MNTRFAILGRILRATGIDHRIGAWLERSWHFPHQLSEHSYGIALQPRQAPTDLSRGTWMRQLVTLPDRTLVALHRANLWVLPVEEGGVALTLRPGEASIATWGDWSTENPYYALHLALTEAIRASGLLPLHAAVAARDAEATAFPGASGVGKSTTLLRLTGSGWTAIAEDLSWLEPESMRVFGWDRGVRLGPGTSERWFGRSGHLERDGKVYASYQELGTHTVPDGVLRQVAMLVRADDAAPRWEPAAAHEGVRALWECTGIPLTPDARETATRGIEQIASRVTFSRLVLGRIGEEIPSPPGTDQKIASPG